jgi:energy-coupling factor transporter transmembrane protein EcfT
MGGSKFSFFVIDILLLIAFLGLMRMIFRFNGLRFLLELLAVVILLFIAFIALIPAYSGSKGGWGFLSGVFFLILLNLLVIYIRTNMWGKLFLGTSLFAALGFVISVANIKKEEEEFYEGPVEEEKEEEVYTNFEPGKYVATKTGSTYHIPKCDWAKKIKKSNQVWFDDEKAAKKNYKKHSCVK